MAYTHRLVRKLMYTYELHKYEETAAELGYIDRKARTMQCTRPTILMYLSPRRTSVLTNAYCQCTCSVTQCTENERKTRRARLISLGKVHRPRGLPERPATRNVVVYVNLYIYILYNIILFGNKIEKIKIKINPITNVSREKNRTCAKKASVQKTRLVFIAKRAQGVRVLAWSGQRGHRVSVARVNCTARARESLTNKYIYICNRYGLVFHE